MTPIDAWNLAAWSAQAFVLVAVGGLASTLLRGARPSTRLLLWRGVVLLCLALPWLQTRHITRERAWTKTEDQSDRVHAGLSNVAADDVRANEPDTASTRTASGTFSSSAVAAWAPLLAVALAGGAAARLLVVAVGLVRLRRLRHAGDTARLSDDEDALRYMTCRHADVRDVPGLPQPVTFGLARPVVLLPVMLQEQDVSVRRAVLSHELLHAQRGDWGWVVLEEIVRAVCWFHPGIWWAISQIQLSREEVVDDGAARLTGSRRAYIDALLLFSNSPQPIVAPAFGRPRQLFRRIQLIAKEPAMSARRLVVSLVCTGVAIVLALVVSARSFPLAAAQEGYLALLGPQELSAQPVTPENPIPNRIVTVEPEFPEATALERGLVTLKLTIDGRGHVVEVRQIGFSVDTSDPRESLVLMLDPFPGREQALDTLPKPTNALAHLMTGLSVDAAFQWRYEPPRAAPLAFYASVVFSRRLEDRVRISQTSVRPLTTSDQVDQLTVRFGQAAAMAALNASPRTGNDIFGLPSNVPPPAPDAPIAPVTSTATGSRADSSRATTTIVRDVNGEPIALLIQPAQGAALATASATPVPPAAPPPAQSATSVAVSGAAAPAPPPPPPPPAQAPSQTGVEVPAAVAPPLPPPAPPPPNVNLTSRQDALMVGGNIVAPKKIKDVRPVYPPSAEAAGISGIVILQAVIDESGRVTDTVVLRSVNLLDEAAAAAVRQWEFQPTRLNGVPVAVVMTVTVRFSLN